MFHLMFSLPWLIVATRFIAPLPWPLMVKVLLAAFLLVASQYHLFSRFTSGSVFAPEFPRPLVIGFNLFFGAIVLLAMMQVALDLVSLLISAVKWSYPAVPAEVRYTMGIAAVLLASFGISQAIRVPPLKQIEVVIPGLAPEFDGYRMVQLTDLHISRLFTGSWAAAVVEKTNALDADLIVITGDLIDGSVDIRREDIAPLGKLTARDGVLTVPGNHEYFFDIDRWLGHFPEINMRILANEHAVIERGEGQLVVAGVTDLSARFTGAVEPDLGKALSGAPANAPVILLDHQPRLAHRAAEQGVALQLSGHTHGGMIRGLDQIVARANSGFVSGFYQVGDMQLYVNNGTGLWPGFALRIGVPAELTEFTLRAAPRM